MNVNDLIERLRYQANISDSPRQMDRLNALADEFAAALEAAREEVAALQAEVEALRDEFHNLRKRAETAWNRGYQQGLAANRLLATQATDALKKEREGHAETNRAMTNALLMMEAREQRDEALLRQALEALERGAWDTLSGRNAAFAIRERLGLGQEECKGAEGKDQ